jgi:hypothetical protein
VNNNRWVEAGIEPKVEDLLDDPIIDLILQHDRISLDDVWAAIRAVRPETEATAA